MRNMFTSQKGYGGVEMFLCAVVIGIIMYFYFYPASFKGFPPEVLNALSRTEYCSDFLDPKDAPVIEGPAYDGSGNDQSTVVIPGKTRKYRMLKRNVPMSGQVYHLKSIGAYTDPETGKRYSIDMPASEQGTSYPYSTKDKDGNVKEVLQGFRFADYGLIMLQHPGGPIGSIRGGKEDIPILLVDIYKAVDLPELPPEVINCATTGSNLSDLLIDPNPYKTTAPLPEMEMYYPNATGSPFRAEEQLNWFLFKRDRMIYGSAWWTPHCKPAIYLYPPKEQKVNVQVAIPQGEFLYTDPVYPKGGWNVIAKPNGELTYLGSNRADSKGVINYGDGMLPYLYYEGRIHDSVIEKPTKGFVKKQEELDSFLEELLPNLGLNAKESKEFKDYWLKALPKASYYFIGIVPQSNLNEIEPLTITPAQDTTIRVTLYFEALGTLRKVEEPQVQRPIRNGFTVVEWGGMVKADKNNPFTCLQ